MQLCKAQLGDGEIRVGVVREGHVRFLDTKDCLGIGSLSDVLHSDHPSQVAGDLIDDSSRSLPVEEVTVLAPIDRQEVWAAGVTYKRSQVARMEESETGASHYDRVYSAPRPELFFKAMPRRM